MLLSMFEQADLGCARIAKGTVAGHPEDGFAMGAHTRRGAKK